MIETSQKIHVNDKEKLAKVRAEMRELAISLFYDAIRDGSDMVVIVSKDGEVRTGGGLIERDLALIIVKMLEAGSPHLRRAVGEAMARKSIEELTEIMALVSAQKGHGEAVN